MEVAASKVYAENLEENLHTRQVFFRLFGRQHKAVVYAHRLLYNLFINFITHFNGKQNGLSW